MSVMLQMHFQDVNFKGNLGNEMFNSVSLSMVMVLMLFCNGGRKDDVWFRKEQSN